MAQFFSSGDLREAAKAVVPVDWETGDALGSADHPMHVEAAAGDLVVADGWTVDTTVDTTLNSADKWFDVPAGRVWQILSVYVQHTSDATVGTRRLCVQWTGNGVLGWVAAGVTQAASLTYYYTFAPGLADLTATRGTASSVINTPIPPTIILPGACRLRVFDMEAIATAADDMRVGILYAFKNA